MLPRIASKHGRAASGLSGSTARTPALTGPVRSASFRTSFHHPPPSVSISSTASRRSPLCHHLPTTPTATHHHQTRSSSSSSSSSTHTRGSYHSPTSSTQTMLSDIPSISPRSLVKYLDSYVVGQTRAKKVLAVGVWNHYLRVASNQRMREEAEHQQKQQDEQEQEEEVKEEEAKRDVEMQLMQGSGLSEATSRTLRLGKWTSADDAAVKDGWRSQQRIEQEREAERVRDPHGEATRKLMFGRSEREWLVNSGGSAAIVEEDDQAAGKAGLIAPKFGDDLIGGKRVSAKTPAEEAASHLEQRKWSSTSGQESALAEAASRLHDAVLADYTPGSGREEEKAAKIGVLGADEAPLYFSSNTVRGSRKTGGKVAAEEVTEKKWESPQERAAYAAGLAEERTRRALRIAKERLSSTSSNTSDPRAPTPPNPITAASSSPLNPSFLSSSPGTLPFFEKSNILLLGPSGSGKTLLLRTLAQALDVPFVHVDATPLTMAGYVGEDVESIIQRLLVEAGWDVERAQRGIVCIDEIDKLRKTGKAGGGGAGGGKDVGGEGVQQALLRMLEGTTIQVANKGGAASAAAGAGMGGGMAATATAASKTAKTTPAGNADSNGGVDGAGSLGPWYNHRRARADPSAGRWNPTTMQSSNQPSSFNVDTSSILFVLSGAFVGIEDVIRKRLQPPPPPPAAVTGNTPSPSPPDETAPLQLTQTDLLSRLEPTDLESYGMIPEFIGRVPVSVVLNPLTHQDLVRVMTEPRNSLVDQYTSLFKLNGIELHISAGAVEAVVDRAMGTTPAGQGKSGEGGGGARSLRRIMEEVLLDAFYESYGSSSVKYILVDGVGVREGRVGLFSRGQRFEFEARVRGEAEEWTRREQERKKTGVDKEKEKEKEKGLGGLDTTRTTAARNKARALIRSRLRRTNRLVDPVIYV